MPRPITSLQNPRIKNAAQLRNHRARQKQTRILIDGVREVTRAWTAGVEFVELFFCPELADTAGQELAYACEQRGVDVWSVTRAAFEKLAFGDRVDGIVAVARPPACALAEITLGNEALLLVLEAVEKPGNVGAAVRSAAAVGVDAVFIADGGTDVYSPNVIRASLGAVFTLPVCAASSAEILAWLRQQHVRILAARVDGRQDYWDVALLGRCAFVLGSEAAGLSDVWQDADVLAVRLPMSSQVDSLNVSTTAAVLLYEAARQRRGTRASRNRGCSEDDE
jgi:TrmH family RNA methyltransferase